MRSHDTVEKERLHSSFPFRFTSAPSAGRLLPICLHRPPLSLSWKLLLNSVSSVEASSSNAGVSLVLGSPRQAVGSSSDLSRQERHDRAPSAHHGRPGTEKQACSFVLRGLPPFPLLFLAGPQPKGICPSTFRKGLPPQSSFGNALTDIPRGVPQLPRPY